MKVLISLPAKTLVKKFILLRLSYDNVACEQALHLRDIVKNRRVRGTREETGVDTQK